MLQTRSLETEQETEARCIGCNKMNNKFVNKSTVNILLFVVLKFPALYYVFSRKRISLRLRKWQSGDRK